MLAVGFVTTSLVACSDDDSNLITLSDDVPSFTITIPASAEFVLVDRKEATDTDYRRVFQVSPLAWLPTPTKTTFTEEKSYTFTDIYVEAGKIYSYRYQTYDGSSDFNFDYYIYTKSIKATGGIGELAATITTDGSIIHDETKGIVTINKKPTATITPASVE